jgi:hypothetical protein
VDQGITNDWRKVVRFATWIATVLMFVTSIGDIGADHHQFNFLYLLKSFVSSAFPSAQELHSF